MRELESSTIQLCRISEIISRLSITTSHAVINAGNTKIDLEHFQEVLETRFAKKDVRYEVMQGRALVALQGPKSMDILQKFLNEDLKKVAFMTIFNTTLKKLGFEAIISRCGYTG